MHNAWEDVRVFLGILVVILLISFALGDRETTPLRERGTRPERRPVSEITSLDDVHDEVRDIKRELDDITESLNRSEKSGLVILDRGRADRSLPQEEYLTLSTARDLTSPVQITGWELVSTETGNRIILGGGTQVPTYPERRNIVEPIVLTPGQSAHVVTGPSPVGTSFQTSICTGYFEDFHDFQPRLTRDCPRIWDDTELLEDTGFDLDEYRAETEASISSSLTICLNEVRRINRCKNPDRTPDNVSRSCREFIESIDYELCVDRHQNDASFERDEWYIYANQHFDDLWRDSSDTILLLDAEDKIVARLSY